MQQQKIFSLLKEVSVQGQKIVAQKAALQNQAAELETTKSQFKSVTFQLKKSQILAARSAKTLRNQQTATPESCSLESLERKLDESAELLRSLTDDQVQAKNLKCQKLEVENQNQSEIQNLKIQISEFQRLNFDLTQAAAREDRDFNALRHRCERAEAENCEI
ncbi:hypothetical protein SS50377_26163 [Spironucleus salmonicida]|uniref:Uncharacterized protein n=1 Tax=Spironucleus salmonicida TaxID=348837 RepID=V6LMG3_9EUKA|nr:hypothetical protein SS50377_26163 [Spironucleus salmonicida]|eukprot:EST44896.1 Hypothetical protein SS50377_15188 [Spironucleus salmonicida]